MFKDRERNRTINNKSKQRKWNIGLLDAFVLAAVYFAVNNSVAARI